MSTSIMLDPDTERRLDALAAQAGQTRSQLMREMLASGLSTLEAYYLGAAAGSRADLVCAMDSRRSDLVINE